MRSLSPDEAALWARVAATITPLSRDKVQKQQAEAPPPAHTKTAPPLRKAPAAPARSPARPGSTLDGSWDKKLRSGGVQPDRTVDLHGMNLDGAWQAIDLALEDAIAAGDRVLLLITGHHRPSDPPIVRGRIRAAVHDWLAVSRHAAQIAAVRGAHPRHGGQGSLYLILRRR
ncbi:MAG: hypothetical protein AVDCRST_MAG44-1281 [uncultured Sphingomonas sp.]|uniref:Smr domain-containing protein n=1 Tax=uncultured Sphingomonas sp. TaxID=158754 RepID=A0A6J4SZE5_9SPHN|nr:MAG: hypothetical protein AVDCRST_MAG44-1281 [uncultured Sphingomonas sp.]